MYKLFLCPNSSIYLDLTEMLHHDYGVKLYERIKTKRKVGENEPTQSSPLSSDRSIDRSGKQTNKHTNKTLIPNACFVQAIHKHDSACDLTTEQEGRFFISPFIMNTCMHACMPIHGHSIVIPVFSPSSYPAPFAPTMLSNNSKLRVKKPHRFRERNDPLRDREFE
jgi:hypothetical protein